MGTTVNITDAYLVHPVAMEHARCVIAGELDMLHRGIGKKKRIEWLAAQRDMQCRDSALFIPLQIAPALEAMTTKDTVTLLDLIGRSLASMKIGTTLRHLRNAQRRMGLPGNVLDPLIVQGAMLLLAGDKDFASSYKRASEPFLQHLESTPHFQIGHEYYNEVMSSHDLETNKQRKLIEYLTKTIPAVLQDMPDIDDKTIREMAYMYGRLLDQDIMLTLSMIVREMGAGVFDQLSFDIIDHAIITYRVVVTGLINDRITELCMIDSAVQPSEITQSAPDIQVDAPVRAHELPIIPAKPMPDLLSINDTAEYLRVTRVTIGRLLKSGALSGTHVGRRHLVSRASIDRYLAL